LNSPLVTVGVPVYRGQQELPVTLECLRTQTYPNLDVLISVDAGDQDSARACEPFLRGDARFRMRVQPSRLGWAGNTDWTMRERRGEFYIFQQHDDQVSPTYVADLVEAASRTSNAAICFAEVPTSGLQTMVSRGFELSGGSIERVLAYLETLDCVPFRGLIRGSALASTSGLLLSDFDPFDSCGTEMRFMAQLALWGEFRFVPGPIYYKRLHGANLHLKRQSWSEHQKQLAWASLAAWMIEVVAPAGGDTAERRRLFDIVLARFLVPNDPWKWARAPARRLASTSSTALRPLRVLLDRLKHSERILNAVSGRWMLYETSDPDRRAALLGLIFDRLESGGRFDPSACLQSTWEALEMEASKRFIGRLNRGTKQAQEKP
jgi:glycosyltransferase involved in cell wall biosynthesis